MNKFPERLKEVRKKKKINQAALSKHLNYGYTAIANYESGRNEPSFDVLIKLAEYFDVSVGYLVGCEDEPYKAIGMNAEEKEVLQQYTKLSEEERKMIRDLMNIIVSKK